MPRRVIDITPDKSLMEKMGYVGFKPEEAFAEFIDNSIDAIYDPVTSEPLVPLPITVTITLEKDRIEIYDNSSGILDFDNCLRLAFSEKNNDFTLGEFGLGLKTASMSLGRKVTIVSKRLHENEYHKTVIDMDEWYNDPHWRITVEDYPADENEHWTKIIIEKLHVDPTLYIEELLHDLAERFGEFVENKEIKIIVNGRTISPEPVEFMEKDDPRLLKALKDLNINDFEIYKEFKFDINGFEIHGWVTFLKDRSLTGRFGFNIYRGKRLITPYVKIGIRDHPTNANIFGHIYLPKSFPVSFTKTRIEIQRNVYRELEKKMRAIADVHKRLSQKMAQERIPTVSSKTITKLSENLEILQNVIPKSQLIKDILPEMPSERKRALPDDAEGYGSVDSEKRGPRKNPSIDRPIPKNKRVRNPRNNKQKKNFWYITLPIGKIKLIHDFLEIEDNPPKMYYCEFNEDTTPPEFRVTTNTRFTAWGTTKDEAFYATNVVITALSKLIDTLSGNNKATYIEIYEEIWRLWGREVHKKLAKR